MPKPKAPYPTQIRFQIYVQALAITPKGTILLANSSFNRLGIYPKRGKLALVEVHAPRGLALSSDGTEVAWPFTAMIDSDGTKIRPGLTIRDAETGAERGTIGIPDNAQALAWSPDGKHLAVPFYPGSIEVYEADAVRAGKKAKPVVSFRAGTHALVWDPDGESVLQPDGDGGLVRYTLGGNTSRVRVNPGDNRLVSAKDGTLAVPTVVFSAGGRVRWKGPVDRYCEAVAFSPDGSKLVCAAGQADKVYAKNYVPVKPKGMEVAFVAVHDAASGTCLDFVQRTVMRPPRALAVNEEIIVVGRDSGAEIYPWSAFKV